MQKVYMSQLSCFEVVPFLGLKIIGMQLIRRTSVNDLMIRFLHEF